MIAEYATTLLVGATSAFLPVSPVEPYVIAVVATTGDAAWILGTAAGAGQTVGKLLIFLAARGTLRSTWVRRRLTPAAHQPRLRERTKIPATPGMVKRWTTAAITRLARPRQATVLFTSAVTGLPPLLITSVHAARTSMSAVVFGITCLAGRTIRFSLVASVPGLLDFLHRHL
jgi:membrane protein YqaA with SNARE-associated domain